MGVFEQFPYANMHEMNLDWLLKKMKELDQAMETFKATESLKFADPIIWDITTQYEKSTIVLDPTGNAYLSLQAVPAGVQLNNEEYWLEIFNFTDYTRTANQNLTVNVETNTTRATAAYQVDDWLIWNDVLYKVTAAIAIDDALIVAPAAGSNIVHFTVEDFIKAFITYATGLINQYKNDIDASELAYKNEIDASELAFTNDLQSRFNQAIAGLTVDSEVVSARMQWNGVTQSTLKESIDKQIEDCINITANNIGRFPTPFRIGTYAIVSNVPTYQAFPQSICSTVSYKSTRYMLLKAETGYQIHTIENHNGTWASSGWLSSKLITPNTELYLIIREYPLAAGDLDWIYQVTARTPAVQLQRDALSIDPKLIEAGNYADLLPDADNVNTNTVYILNYVKGDINLPANLPWSSYPYDKVCSIETIAVPYSSSTNIGAIQTIRSLSGDVWKRTKGIRGWSDWNCIKGGTITVGVDVGTFLEGIQFANTIPHSTVYVNSGFYDILDELTTYNPDFLTNYTVSQKYGRGIEIGNDTKIIASNNAVLLCNYTGSDNTFMAEFSPLMTLASDFEIHGLRIIASNVRYGIHDDPLGSGEKAKRWSHKYNQMQIRVDNSSNPNVFKACIGGGLGKQSLIEVTDCLFESIGLADNQAVIGWHNCILDDSVSRVVIKNNYMVTGTYRAGYYGPSVNITNNLVSDNSMKSAPFVAQEDPNYTNVNMAIYSWNNEIRS